MTDGSLASVHGVVVAFGEVTLVHFAARGLRVDTSEGVEGVFAYVVREGSVA